MLDLTIGQLVDALREACLRDLGVEVNLSMAAWYASGHEQAEKIAIIMARELGGKMSEIQRTESVALARWYNVSNSQGRIYFTVYWVEKENDPQQVAV